MKITKSDTFFCSAEELWTWLNDFGKVKQWNKTILDEKHISSGNIRVGFTTNILINEELSETWYTSEILRYDPSTFLSFSLSGGKLGKNPMIVEYRLIPEKNNTVLNYSCRWAPHGFMLKMADPVISRIARKNIENAFAELSKLIIKTD